MLHWTKFRERTFYFNTDTKLVVRFVFDFSTDIGTKLEVRFVHLRERRKLIRKTTEFQTLDDGYNRRNLYSNTYDDGISMHCRSHECF